MTDQPTDIIDPELADYHTARLDLEHAKTREQLARHIAEHALALGPVPDHPDMYATIHAFSLKLALPLADAVLACPGITYTGDGS